MRFCVIDSEFMKYLRKVDNRVPYDDYGNSYKPCFYSLFEIDGLVYVTYITSPKRKHHKMKNMKDFKKVFIDTNKRKGRFFVGAINLNHMFPVPKRYISDVKFANIDKIRKFDSEKAKSKYISLLKHELSSINKMNLSKAAKELYEFKYSNPDSPISERCLNFKELETAAKKYHKAK